MRILKDLWALTIIIVMMAGWFTTLCQRDTAIQRYEAAEFTVEQRDKVIDALEEWDRASISEVTKLNADIRALEGRIRKMTGAYQIREMELLEEINRLNKQLELCNPIDQEPIEPAPPIPGCR